MRAYMNLLKAVLVTALVATGVATTASHASATALVITSPVSGAELCDGPGPALTVVGSGAAPTTPLYVINNGYNSAAEYNADGDGNFAIPVYVAPGPQSFYVLNFAGASFPTSNTVDVTVYGINDAIGAMSASPLSISPDGDGLIDSVGMGIHVERAGSVRFTI
jgi:hypothetical protein